MNILQVIKSQPTQDGDGVKIRRVADFQGALLDPFLMIDELKSDDESDYIGGFPPHPHRGIETFTYMLQGGFEHRDQMGNKGIISDGHVQWMSTGFGVVHSEMPVETENGLHGFQIWVNMPAKDKLRPARYQDTVDEGIPEILLSGGGRLRALAGQWAVGAESIISPITTLAANAAIADVYLNAGDSVDIAFPPCEQLMVYVHTSGLNDHDAGHLLVLDPSSPMLLKASRDCGALIFRGDKLREPIAHMGPFVMNTQEELRQAVMDYQMGKLGQID